MGEEPVIKYMFPQEPKTVEELEESRRLYMTLFDIADRSKLKDHEQYFLDKVEETTRHIELVKGTPEEEIKSKMLIFWKGLLDEVRRRL